MALFHLIYVSTAVEEFGVDELSKILESSVRHNTERGMTGMLLYSHGSFMQVLEGNQADVEETFRRIERDPRHMNLHVIEHGRIRKRSFDRWSMGFRHLGAVDVATRPGYAAFFEEGFDPVSIGARPGLALNMLINFGVSQGRSARGLW